MEIGGLCSIMLRAQGFKIVGNVKAGQEHQDRCAFVKRLKLHLGSRVVFRGV